MNGNTSLLEQPIDMDARPPRPIAGQLFRTFLLGGFECSTHRLKSKRRLDVIAATRHDQFALADYQRLRGIGISAARDGTRWHLIENSPGQYDFSSVVPMLRAARTAGVQVIWDMLHYGWPDHFDIFKPAFVDGLAKFVRAFVRLHSQETDEPPLIAPVNEISFFAWAGGTSGIMNPCKRGRGNELKRQLLRAGIAATQAAREANPRTRIVWPDPIIHVVGAPEGGARARASAAAYRESQFEGWDTICGRRDPGLGGKPEYLDIVGANFYSHNQWFADRAPGQRRPPFISRRSRHYLPLRELLAEVYARYQRPLFLAETGIEARGRPEWFRYVCGEVSAARKAGTPVGGICWYPIVNHPGWVNNRHCHNGLWDYADRHGEREIFAPLAEEFARQRVRFETEAAD